MCIEIVTHCYAEQLPQYAEFLRFQLSSLLLHMPDIPVSVAVCFSPTDERVITMLHRFESQPLMLHHYPMPTEQVCRRSIGRNRVARASQSDLVWFADVDYVFHKGCLDTLWKLWQEFDPKPSLIYPRVVKAHKSHSLGDAMVKRSLANPNLLVDIDVEDFEPKHETRAIGGLQIVGGDLARKYGYLPHRRHFQLPRAKWIDTEEDPHFRKQCSLHGILKRVELPGLYRIRHSKATHLIERRGRRATSTPTTD